MELRDEVTAGMAVIHSVAPAIRMDAATETPAADIAEPVINIVDDDPEVCRALRFAVESAGFRVATYATAREFLSGDAAVQPGCLILDIRLPGTNGLELQERLVALGSSIPVIVISGYADVPLAVRAMRRGAIDLLEKPFDHQLLLDRIRQAVEIDRQTHLRRRDTARVKARLDRLTPREREVMRLVVQGYANKRIAATLGISMKTVEAHRAHVMRKMKAESLAELVKMAPSAENESGR
jgi:FixJ family two-component response regulator